MAAGGDRVTGPGEDDDHAYFQAIEETFVALRGAPLLLSPADWQVSRRWHRDGIPLDLIRGALREVFERRKERGAKGKISSLRYCAPAVEAAWEERRELSTPGERAEAPAFDLAARLHTLAGRLPAAFPGRDLLAGRVETLGGDPETVEEALAGLDREMLAAATAALGAPDREAIAAAVEKTLTGLRGRLPAAELERSRERLAHQILRQRLGLPVLSLFSPDAES
jgi:hypothetical protein